MDEDQRVRRPALDRTTPIRNWNTIISASPIGTDNQIGQDVQNANSVVEEYLRAGEASARVFQRALGTAPGVGDSQDIAQRMIRAASDLMTFWLEFVARSAGGTVQTPQRPSTVTQEPVVAGNEPSVQKPLHVTVEVDSVRPTKVTVDLRPEARGSKLCVDRLHAWGSNAVSISGAEIDSSIDDHGIVVRLVIDRDQPTGIYNGVILNDATSLPVGTVSVEVQSPRLAAARLAAQ